MRQIPRTVLTRFMPAGAALLAVLLAAVPSARAADVRLARFALDASVAKNTTIHPVNLLGGPELELALVDPRGQLSIYGQTPQGFVLLQQLQLPVPADARQHVYYGFARLESPDRYSLVILAPTSVNFYPVQNNLLAPEPQPLFQSELVTEVSPGPTHRPFDMALDLDGDGLDELLLPSDTGFSISRRNADGSFSKIKLPRTPFSVESTFTFGRDIPQDAVKPPFAMASLEKKRGTSDLLFFDADGDGKLDLIYSSTATGAASSQVERYDVFLQRDDLTFDSKPSQSFAVPYDSQADVTFRDINQDGKLDAILVRSNLDMVNPRTVIKFFVGDGSPYQVFTNETDRFVTKDPVGLVQLNDFNGDGVTDFAMTYFSYQFGSMEDIVDLAFANKLQFRLQFFLGRAKTGFPRKPDSEQHVTLNTKLENFRGNPPVMLVKDMNGDGMMDLVVRNSPTELQIFMSRGNFALNSTPTASFPVPENASLAFVDVNGDGLNDIIVSEPDSGHFSVIVPLKR